MFVNRSLYGKQLTTQEEHVSREEEADSESEEDMEESSPDESSISIDEVVEPVLENEEEEMIEQSRIENGPSNILESSASSPSIASDISIQQSPTVDAIPEEPQPKRRRIEVVERNQDMNSKQKKTPGRTQNKSQRKTTKSQNMRERRVRGKELTQEQKDDDYEG